MYNKRTWLNAIKSDSTGSVVAFDGKVTYGNELVDSTFLEVSDCRHKIRLHLTSDDDKQDFIDKMKLLRNEIDEFINHLEKDLNEGIRESETKSCGSCRYAYIVGLKRCNSCTPPTYEKWEQDEEERT